MISVAMAPRSRMRPMIRPVGVHQRLAAAERDDAGAQLRQPVHAAKHLTCRNGRRMIVELIAIRASQVTASYRDEVGGDRLVRGPEGRRRACGSGGASFEPSECDA